MKKILMVLAMVILLVGCKDEKTIKNPNEYGLDMMNIKGDVIKIEQYCYTADESAYASFDNYDMGYFSGPHYIAEYDAKGNPISIKEYSDPEGDHMVEWVSTYDDNNILSSFEARFSDYYISKTNYDMKDGKVIIEDQRITGERYDETDGLHALEGYIIIELDDQNRQVNYTFDGESSDIPTYEYNEAGFVKTANWTDIGELSQTTTFEYDSKGFMTAYTVDNFVEKITYTFKYEYDDKNNWTKQMVYQDGEHLYTNVRNYSYQ